MSSTRWTPQEAERTYNIAQWSEGYVNVNADGNVCVKPFANGGSVDLLELSKSLQKEGLDLPVLVRFPQILHDRVDALTGAFQSVIEELGYTGGYTAVYPIKVNQQRSVVEAIVAHGGARVGLEAGSKPELAAVLACAKENSVIVCNGYKDHAYIRRALIGQKLGHRVYIVVEKLSELAWVIDESKKLDIRPLIGLRVRLSSISAGNWQNTGGEKSKFGLLPTQLLQATEQLRAAGFLDSLRMVHFHLGSQVANVRDIAKGMREAARFYVELRMQGAPLDTLDVGGGLGVDYEGTRSRSYCSMNYSMREYALNIVRTVQEICAESEQPTPHIISESGRALTAHHAVLITSVVDTEIPLPPQPPEIDDDAPQILKDLSQLIDDADSRTALECLHDAASWLSEAQSQYNFGVLNITQRALAEQLYYAVCHAIKPKLDRDVRSQREASEELSTRLAAKYFCNFSVFQSLPDIWAIDQVFPILPIHRLTEKPQLRASLCDLTCDSDGRIDQYVERGGLEPTMPVHELKAGEPYMLAFFMVGAYQEILGDMHNLFGDTNAVNVTVTDNGWHMHDAEHGDRTDELLRYVHFAPEELTQAYRRKMAASNIPANERTALLAELQSGLSGYTYLAES